MDNVFFILSKIGWALLSPANLLMLFTLMGVLFLAFHRIQTAKIILIPTALAALVVLAYPIGDHLIQPLEKRYSKPDTLPENIDGILVLGGGEDLKRSLSWQTAELGLAGDRYIATKQLAMHYPDAPILFTGGSGSVQLQHSDKEGHLAQQLFNALDIRPDRITIETEARNTYENFRNIHLQLPQPKGNYLLVTSAYHMPRAVGVANKQGINVTPYPVDYRSNSDEYRQMNLDFYDHLKTLEPAWKEWIGLTAYYWTGRSSDWFPKPKSHPSKAANGS
ncbi:MAG: YdcF family protein [Hydrogenovibrio sp.]